MYEIKLTILSRLMLAMSNDQAESFMKIIENVLEEPPENSIFRNNINPLRIALQLYKIVTDIHLKFGYSEFATNAIKESISDQIVKVLEIYDDTKDMDIIMDLPDLEGRNCWWYFQNYDLHVILSAKIMDKFIS